MNIDKQIKYWAKLVLKESVDESVAPFSMNGNKTIGDFSNEEGAAMIISEKIVDDIYYCLRSAEQSHDYDNTQFREDYGIINIDGGYIPSKDFINGPTRDKTDEEIRSQIRNKVILGDKEVTLKGPITIETNIATINVKRDMTVNHNYRMAKDNMRDAKNGGLQYHKPNLPKESQEADETGSSSLVWSVTIKSNHGIYSRLLEDGETKEDAIQNANKFLKKLGVDSVAVDAEPHESFYP